MSQASEYIRQLSGLLSQRPSHIVPGPNGPVAVAYIDFVAGGDNGSIKPVVVIPQPCTFDTEHFAELVDWAGKQLNEGDA